MKYAVKTEPTAPKLIMVATMALFTIASSQATTVNFTPTRAASGISWAPNYSVPGTEGGSLAIGALDNGGTPFLTAALLGYDVSGLVGLYASIDSVTLTGTVMDSYPGGAAGTVELIRVGDLHAAWTSSATWADSGGGAWAGGATMGTVETGAALASATVTRGSAVGTVYTWTITGAAAQTLINDWITGTNSGLALVDTGTGGGLDYRTNIGGIQGNVAQPTLTVTFTPLNVPSSLVWQGADGTDPAFWDIGVTANWTGSPNGKFLNGDNVLFDDSATSFTVDVQDIVLPNSVTVDNTTSYIISSSNNSGIDGSGGLVKNGSGLLTITAENNFSGSVAINHGTVSVPAIANSLTPLGQGSVISLGDNTHAGTLQYTGTSVATNRAITIGTGGGVVDVTTVGENLTWGGVISGGGGLTKTGGGSLTLSGNNLYAGGTHVASGTLALAPADSVVSGLGAITGSLTVGPGASLTYAQPNPFGFVVGQSVNELIINGGTVGNPGYGNTFFNSFNLTMTGGTLNLGYDPLQSNNDFHNATILVNSSSSTATIIAVAPQAVMRLRDGMLTTFDVADGSQDVDLLIAADITESEPTALLKTGPGTLSFTGDNSHTGTTTVSGGTLAVNGSNDAASAVTIHAGATLAGTGIAAGPVTVAAGAFVAPGNGSTGVLGTGATTLDGTYQCQINGTASDRIVVTGDLTIHPGSTIAITTPGTGATEGSYIIATYTGTLGGSTPAVSGLPDGYALNLATPNQIRIVKSGDYADWLGGFTFAPGDDTTPAGDPDRDGLNNQQEYAFGLNPTSGSSVAAITVPLDKGTGLFTYHRRKPSLTLLSYKIWTSTDLVAWEEDINAIQASTDNGNNQSVTVTITGTKPLTESKLFVRVTAE